MQKLLAVGMLLVAATGCAGGMSASEARQQVTQLITLYQENRAKFVEQKQQIVQAPSCDRATALKAAADKLVAEAAMSPENTQHITVIQMELAQAEKDCLAK